MTIFLQQLINGLSLGSIYALMAVGYSLVYSILNFSNFAHGGIIMLGAYFGVYVLKLVSVPFAVVLVIAAFLAGLVAVILERIAYRPLRLRVAPPLYFIISAMGASIFLENLVIATIGPNFQSYDSIISGSIKIGELSIGILDLTMLGITAVSLTILVIILNKTKMGLAIRATSYSTRGSQFMGVNVDKIIFTIFLIGGMLGGIAGVLFGMKYVVYPQIGIITNKSFIAAVFGGLGSLPGAVIGSIVVGLVEAMVAAYISSSYKDLFVFALLIVVLVVKPTGLMGKNTEDKA